MFFKDITGQQGAKNLLINSVREERVSHAQLFLGAEGSGNLPLAIAYAQYISCAQRSGSDSCGTCASCIKYSKLVHPDLHFVFPVNTSKEVKNASSNSYLGIWREEVIKNPYLSIEDWYEAMGIENKQGIINAEESSEVLKKLSLKSYESEYKVMIIWHPEKMNHAAANKLLKIIEEPPDKTLFILVAENQEEMLPTILSRTQLIKVFRLSDEEIKEALIESKGLNPELAAKCAFLAEGNYNEALKLAMENEEEGFYATSFISWMRLCWTHKTPEIVDWVQEISEIGREKQKSFLSYALHIIRESLLMNFGSPEMVKLAGAELDFLQKFHPFINGVNGAAFMNEMNDAYGNIERNANPKILFLDLSLKASKLLKETSTPHKQKV